MMCHRIGLPPISTMGFGRMSVSSVRRESRVRRRGCRPSSARLRSPSAERARDRGAEPKRSRASSHSEGRVAEQVPSPEAPRFHGQSEGPFQSRVPQSGRRGGFGFRQVVETGADPDHHRDASASRSSPSTAPASERPGPPTGCEVSFARALPRGPRPSAPPEARTAGTSLRRPEPPEPAARAVELPAPRRRARPVEEVPHLRVTSRRRNKGDVLDARHLLGPT